MGRGRKRRKVTARMAETRPYLLHCVSSDTPVPPHVVLSSPPHTPHTCVSPIWVFMLTRSARSSA